MHGKLRGQAAPFLLLHPFPMAEVCEDRAAISCLPSAQRRSNVCNGVYRGQTCKRKSLWQGRTPLETQSEGGLKHQVRLLAPSL